MQVSDRRFARRFSIAKRVHFSLWNSHAPEQVVESVNISERGTYFETHLPPDVGATLQLQIEMPEEVTGVPAAEWRCLAKVVHTSPLNERTHTVGVGVRLDFYEVVRLAPLRAERDLESAAAQTRGHVSDQNI